MTIAAMERCFSCGGVFAACDGPTHPYMLSTAGCWAAYGDVLAREYADPELFKSSHRLTVDAYALQHPGQSTDRRAVQSVWVHFAALEAIFERAASHDAAREVLSERAGGSFGTLPAMPISSITVADVANVPIAEHAQSVEQWARAAYLAWKPLLR